MIVLDYVETLSGDELKSVSGMWSSAPHAEGQNLGKAAECDCSINASLLGDFIASTTQRAPGCPNQKTEGTF